MLYIYCGLWVAGLVEKLSPVAVNNGSVTREDEKAHRPNPKPKPYGVHLHTMLPSAEPKRALR
jgi:hypothetical protein